jgi:hypothetical protein
MKAVKYDTKKSRLDLLPPRAIFALGHVMGFGAEKYAEWNYLQGKGLQPMRLVGAAMRHLMDYSVATLTKKTTKDAESGLEHLAHASACCLMALEIQIKRGSK